MLEGLLHWNFRRIEECRTLIEWLDPAPGERILDLGCGDGYYDRLIAARGANVVGVDIHARRLARARRLHQTERTRFLAMDAEELSFPDASFDKVVSFCVIEHFAREQRVVDHVARVLRSGGTFVLSADSLSHPEITPGERERHRRKYAVNTFYTPEVLETKLRHAGLELLETRYILTTRLTLALARLSWRLDDLPPGLSWIGYLLLGTVGKLLSDLSERRWPRPACGLTLLARARKP